MFRTLGFLCEPEELVEGSAFYVEKAASEFKNEKKCSICTQTSIGFSIP